MRSDLKMFIWMDYPQYWDYENEDDQFPTLTPDAPQEIVESLEHYKEKILEEEKKEHIY